MAEIDNELPVYTTKRCPYCFTPLKLTATRCVECKEKVGLINELGLAKKPPNYKAYSAALLWIIALGIYIWKIFFEKWLS